MASPVRRWLERSGVVTFSAFAITAAFTAYFSMYAFRKPFAASEYEGEVFSGDLSLKTALIISQVLGYALSKWLGIKFVSELRARHRTIALVCLIGFAHLALLMFAVVPPQLRVLAIFFNGLPLGAVWGLVFGFLEGRRTSEILGAGLSAAYIVASGAVKGIGRYVVGGLGVSEAWMPAAVGLIFLPVFLIAVWALQQLPPPSAEDELARVRREPMNGEQRRAFFREFAPGLLALTCLYVLLTAYRDFRDSFAVEIWTALGKGDEPAILAWSELPVAAGVLIALGALYLIRDNRAGLAFTHAVMVAGTAVIALATLLFDAGAIDGTVWMISVGLGLYLAYVPFGCMLFDRMIAALGVVATAVFVIYVADAAGYLGAIAVMLYREFGQAEMSWLDFFRYFSYFTSLFCAACLALSAVYFDRRARRAAYSTGGVPLSPSSSPSSSGGSHSPGSGAAWPMRRAPTPSIERVNTAPVIDVSPT